MPNIPHEYDPPWSYERELFCPSCESYYSSSEPTQGVKPEWCPECERDWMDEIADEEDK